MMQINLEYLAGATLLSLATHSMHAELTTIVIVKHVLICHYRINSDSAINALTLRTTHEYSHVIRT